MKKYLLGFIFTFLLSINANQAGALEPPRKELKYPFNVVTTIGQITDITKNIGGDKVNVQGLMGAGVDPHLYKASEGDMRKLSGAEMILYNGLYLEAKMETVFEKMSKGIMTVSLGEAIDKSKLLDSISYAGHHDPHVWFDVPLWMEVVREVERSLSVKDPINSDYYNANTTAYLSKLKELEQYVSDRASELPEDKRVLVTAHDAFRYFGKKYGFEVVGLQGMSTEAEAGTADVINLADMIAERKIRAIFIESSVPERNIKAVQEAVKAKGWEVAIGGELFSDAMGNEGTFEGTYIGMVTHNINTIVDALKE